MNNARVILHLAPPNEMGKSWVGVESGMLQCESIEIKLAADGLQSMLVLAIPIKLVDMVFEPPQDTENQTETP